MATAINISDLSQSIVAAADKVTESQVPWATIETNARELANVLRSKDSSGKFTLLGRVIDFQLLADLHSVLGKGTLPSSIVALLSKAFKEGIPNQAATLASFELFRLAANLCMDHGSFLIFLIFDYGNLGAY